MSITETVQPGFTLHQGAVGQNAVCTRLDTGASVPITNLTAGFTVTGSSTFPISCLVYNQAPPLVVPASIQVDKTWVVDGVSFPDGSQPTGLTADLVLDGSAQPWGTARTGLVAGDSVGIAENVTISLPLCTLADQVLTPVTPAGPPGSLPDDVELVGGANLYSVTNTVTCQAQLTLLKEVQPNGAVDPALWSLNAAAPAGALPGPTGTTGVTALVTPLELYTLSESGGDPRFTQLVGPNAVAIPGSTISWRCVLVDESGQPIPPGTVFDGLNGGVARSARPAHLVHGDQPGGPAHADQDGGERRRRHGDAGRLPDHGHAGRPPAPAARARPRHRCGVGDRHGGAGAAGRQLRAHRDRTGRLRRDRPGLRGHRPAADRSP